jgi:hypothetical protein
MIRLLFATVATAALLLAAPMATAQYGTPAQPETTQSQTAPYNQPDMPPPTDMTTVPDETPAYGDTAASTQSTPPTASTYDSTTGATASMTPDAYGASSTTTDTQTAGAYDSTTAAATTGDGGTYGQASTYTGATPYNQSAAYGPDESSSESMLQHAVDAGMRGVPMSAAEVCAPRDVDLGASSRLNRDNMNKLKNAADRASVCQAQRVVIRAPGARADAIRETLVEHGFDEARIEVEEGTQTAVEMQFAGVATSSQFYAQLYNGAQYASADPSMTQGSSYMSQPNSSYQPNTTDTAPTYDDSVEGGADYTPDSDADTIAPGGMYEPTSDDYSRPIDGQYDI